MIEHLTSFLREKNIKGPILAKQGEDSVPRRNRSFWSGMNHMVFVYDFNSAY